MRTRLLFRTKAEKEADEKLRREEAQWRREQAELDREAEYYGQIIPEMLAQMGIDHQISLSRQPSLAAELLLGQRTRQIVQFLEIHPTPDAIYFWIDTRRLPYLSMLMHMYKAEVLETLSVQCDHQILYRARPGSGAWFILVRSGAINAIPDMFPFEKALAMIPENSSPLTFTVGVGENGAVYTADLIASNNYLLGGAANTGKSVHLNAIICELVARNPSPEVLQFMMFDLKGGVELGYYEGLPHLAWPLVSSTDEVVASLKILKDIIHKRMKQFKQRGPKTIEGWNYQYPKEALPYIVPVFDELGEVTNSYDTAMSKEARLYLGSILSLGRAAGIHAIACTQRPSSEIITSWVKTNCSLRLCLAVPSDRDSMILIDKGMAAGLEPQGRAIYLSGPKLIEVQGVYIEDTKIKSIVREVIEKGAVTPPQAQPISDLQRLLDMAVDNFGGSLDPRPLYQMFKGQIGRDKIRGLLSTLNGHPIEVHGKQYRVVEGTLFSKARHLEEVSPSTRQLPTASSKIPRDFLINPAVADSGWRPFQEPDTEA